MPGCFVPRRNVMCCCSCASHRGDGWSLGPLLRDLSGPMRTPARRAAVVELPVQYGDYTLWQRAILGEERTRSHGGAIN